MKFAAFGTKLMAMAVLAVAMLCSTGCAKEEVVAPSGAMPQLRRTAPVPAPIEDHGGVGVTNTRGDGGVNISDDGDDLGDKERTTKPKPQ